jgi:hypothetical protein
MTLSDNQKSLLDFVTEKHGSQVRKYTGEPYIRHLINVAELVSKYDKNLIEAALCHDLYEDTSCTFNELYKKMVDIGYDGRKAYSTAMLVKELSDVYTSEDYPYLNRAKRKENEAKRLGKISPNAQTIKYCDLLDNTSSIVERDKSFAPVYLQEKVSILDRMVAGNTDLYNRCRNQVAFYASNEKAFIADFIASPTIDTLKETFETLSKETIRNRAIQIRNLNPDTVLPLFNNEPFELSGSEKAKFAKMAKEGRKATGSFTKNRKNRKKKTKKTHRGSK